MNYLWNALIGVFASMSVTVAVQAVEVEPVTIFAAQPQWGAYYKGWYFSDGPENIKLLPLNEKTQDALDALDIGKKYQCGIKMGSGYLVSQQLPVKTVFDISHCRPL